MQRSPPDIPALKRVYLRYGVLLKRRGKLAEAHRVLKDLLDGAQLGPAHYRRAQAPWLDRARRELG